ncbi:MAG TPA: hypothetical protein VK988_11960 [Acidimicrobiales bacterium]|nr:hypothetical protein [Acidimicrobiales bacterium]
MTDDPATAAVLVDEAIAGCASNDVEEICPLGKTLSSWRSEIIAQLRTEVHRLRVTGSGATTPRPAAERSSTASQQRRIDALLDANRNLRAENQQHEARSQSCSANAGTTYVVRRFDPPLAHVSDMSPTESRWCKPPGRRPLQITVNLAVKVKRCGHGFRSFENYRLRVLLHAGGIAGRSGATVPPLRARAPQLDA